MTAPTTPYLSTDERDMLVTLYRLEGNGGAFKGNPRTTAVLKALRRRGFVDGIRRREVGSQNEPLTWRLTDRGRELARASL